MFAVIRIRGSVNRSKEARFALAAVNLHAANHCILLPDDQTSRGVLQKIHNEITWGEITPDMEKALKEKRGDGPVYRLSPPSHGYRSTKLRYPKGDLGYRGAKINDLLQRML
jgi:large subunit ribosomal protein L30